MAGAHDLSPRRNRRVDGLCDEYLLHRWMDGTFCRLVFQQPLPLLSPSRLWIQPSRRAGSEEALAIARNCSPSRHRYNPACDGRLLRHQPPHASRPRSVFRDRVLDRLFNQLASLRNLDSLARSSTSNRKWVYHFASLTCPLEEYPHDRSIKPFRDSISETSRTASLAPGDSLHRALHRRTHSSHRNGRSSLLARSVGTRKRHRSLLPNPCDESVGVCISTDRSQHLPRPLHRHHREPAALSRCARRRSVHCPLRRFHGGLRWHGSGLYHLDTNPSRHRANPVCCSCPLLPCLRLRRSRVFNPHGASHGWRFGLRRIHETPAQVDRRSRLISRSRRRTEHISSHQPQSAFSGSAGPLSRIHLDHRRGFCNASQQESSRRNPGRLVGPVSKIRITIDLSS